MRDLAVGGGNLVFEKALPLREPLAADQKPGCVLVFVLQSDYQLLFLLPSQAQALYLLVSCLNRVVQQVLVHFQRPEHLAVLTKNFFNFYLSLTADT